LRSTAPKRISRVAQESLKMSEEVTPKKLNNAMTVLDTVVEGLVKEKIKEMALDNLTEDVKEYAQKFIRDEYGTVTKKVVITTDRGESVHLDGVLHEKFDEVLAYISECEPVFITGPAGCGKNVLASQIAKTMGLEFYFSNAVTQEYKLTGFTDANGVYHESQFYKAFKYGGLFMLDEMDASCPEALIVLNCALANGYFDFPAPIGKVMAHKDFRVIGAGNTWGTGASYEYCGRTQLDSATLDRFAIVYMGYDERIEMSQCDNDEKLVEFFHDFRQASQKAGVQVIASYRSIKRVHKMKEKIGVEEALKSGLIKGLEKADLGMICPNMVSQTNPYTKALITIRG